MRPCACQKGFPPIAGVAGDRYVYDRFVYDHDVDGQGSTMNINTPNGFQYGAREVGTDQHWDAWGWIPEEWDGSDPTWYLVMSERLVVSLDTHIVTLATRAIQSGNTVDVTFTNDTAFPGFSLGGLAYEWETESQVKGFPAGDLAQPGDIYLFDLVRTDNESGNPDFVMMYVKWKLT